MKEIQKSTEGVLVTSIIFATNRIRKFIDVILDILN